MFGPIINSKEFLASLLADEAKAWDLLYKEGISNVLPVLRSARLYEPKDAWHDTWLEIRLTNCFGYDPTLGEFSGWVLMRATNRARDNQRKMRRLRSSDEASDLASQQSDNEENEGGYQEKVKLLKRARERSKKTSDSCCGLDMAWAVNHLQ